MAKVLFMTRFSYFGVSGWRSKVSASSEMLLNEVRLEKRMSLFENITLPSLAQQSDTDFKIFVLSSNLMSTKWQNRLVEVCNDLLPATTAQVFFRGPNHAGQIFRKIIRRRYETSMRISQVVLDDDDALSNDFVDVCKKTSQEAWRRKPSASDYVVSSFPKGFSLILSGNKYSIKTRKSPFTNLGLTLTSYPTCRRNLFFMSHSKIGTRHPNHIHDDGKAYYLRTVHGSNDSRALVNNEDLVVPVSVVARRFPFLNQLPLHI